MQSDDPFFSPQADDRTVIRPVPGGKRSAIQPSPSPGPVSPASAGPMVKLGRLNPLERSASVLLALVTRLNTSHYQSDPLGLKNKLVKEIEQFQLIAQAEQIDTQTISSARYVLCTVLDEAVIDTPWGNQSGWAQQSLLSLFYKEVSGGERFFDLLKSLSQNPGKNRNLLELMYICLTLGFAGRYRLIDSGKNKLANIREWLYQILQKERGLAEPALSPHWQGVTDRLNPLMKLVPLWVFGAAAAALLAIIFSLFLLKLNQDSDPVFASIHAIKAPVIEVAESAPLLRAAEPQLTLSMLLANEIALKLLSVTELAQRSNVTIQSDNLFDSGSSSVNPKISPVLYRIAESLNQLPGQVLITGHSDNAPIRSARFPSNWHLSKARAEAVAEIIKENLKSPERVTIEGKSDLEPVASNATREGKARNRRVEISLLK
ncbi:MAG: type VI secretion system protein TssL, long form [Methylococcales bacterium]